MENSESQKIIKPIDYVKIFFRRKWFLIGFTYAGLIGGIILAFTMPKSYGSNTVILVEEGKIINPLVSSLAVSTTMTQRMQAIREQMLSWDSLTQLVKKLDLDKEIDSQYEYEQLILKLREKIMVKLRGENLITIAYEDKEPQKAQAVVKTISEIFINENIGMQNKETNDAITFINDQLKLYRRKIKQGEIAGMQEELDNLLIDSTEQHPMVKDLRNKITKAQDDLILDNSDIEAESRAIANQDTIQLRQELEKMRGTNIDELNSGKQSAGTVNDSVYKMLLVDKIGSVLAQDARVDETIYNTLLARLETAKITKRLDASTQGTKYTIIDPPRVPVKPTSPNKLKMILIGIFLGTSAGMGLVFLREFMDHSFLGIDEAKEYLKLPVLGGISRITTVDDLSRERFKLKKRVTLSLATGISLVLIVIAFSALHK